MAFWTSLTVSKNYDLFRIQYPRELYEYILQHAPARHTAIDVGCGTGQAIRGLAGSVSRVIGVDPSDTQIGSAFQAPNVEYIVGPAESFACPPELVGRVDVITIAQAMHWFHMQAFVRQCDRLLKPGGIVAAWTYPLCRVEPKAIEGLLDQMNAEMHETGSWPQERKFVDDNYATLLPNFPTWSTIQFVETAVFPVVRTSTLRDFLQYLSTMSGATQYKLKFPKNEGLVEKYGKEMLAAVGGSLEAPVTATFATHVFILKKGGVSAAKL